MATMKKKAARKDEHVRRARRATKAAPRLSMSSMAAAQFKQLRETIMELRHRLERQARSGAFNSKVMQEAKRARQKFTAQVKALKQEGIRLSKQLRRALGDADRREEARQQALKKIADLRIELGRKGDQVKRKSEELAKLARESATRAKHIILEEVPATATEPKRRASSEGKSDEVHRDRDRT